MSSPLVTIIAPVYNHEEYLDDYFESVINQTYSNIELVLIDDASKDQSKLIIEKWLVKLEERFINLIYIPREKNRGLIYNCNEGLKLSRGKYINVFNTDDVMLPDNIKQKVTFLEKSPDYAMVYSDAYSGLNIKSHSNKLSKHTAHLDGNIFKELINRGNFIPALSVLIRKKVVQEVGGYSSKYMFDDYPMWLEVSYRYKIGYINIPLVYYRLSPNSLSRGLENYKEMIKSQVQLYYDIRDKYNVEIELALRKTYTAASLFFLKYDRTEYKYYRKKIIHTNWEIFVADILYFLRFTPKSMKLVSTIHGSIKLMILRVKNPYLNHKTS